MARSGENKRNKVRLESNLERETEGEDQHIWMQTWKKEHKKMSEAHLIKNSMSTILDNFLVEIKLNWRKNYWKEHKFVNVLRKSFFEEIINVFIIWLINIA